jgi:hypothetical protein
MLLFAGSLTVDRLQQNTQSIRKVNQFNLSELSIPISVDNGK